MKGYRKYFFNKIIWFIVTFIAAVFLNFILPRLMPGDPVAVITARVVQGITDPDAISEIYAFYAREFGLDQPIHIQFFTYVRNLFQGNLGRSFSQFPREVSDIIGNALPWTLALQFPAIVVGWFIGNILGALAAYMRKGFDSVILPLALFISGIPAFGLAVIFLSVFAINLGFFPVSGGFAHYMIPHASWQFFASIIRHYQLPFWTIVIIAIGGQAIGMRSMSIYELSSDYVKYSRYMGIKDRKIVRYVFRNAMLPQITGLSLALGTMVGGALVAEIIFSYPGLGTALLRAIREGDYPLISAVTLIITLMVLVATFVLDIIYAFVDPRIKASQFDN